MKLKAVLPFFLLFPLLFSACKNDAKTHRTPPQNLIPEDQIVEMITDQLILEAAHYIEKMEEHDIWVATEDEYRFWLQKYNITSQQYDESIKYYFVDEEDARRIMTKVQEKITAQRKSLQ